MARLEIDFSAGNSLGKMTSAIVLTPEKLAGPFPVLFLLHGLSDDHSAWTRFSNVERYVSNLPLIVVMPNGERGWYTDALNDPDRKYDSFIMTDLIPYIDATFQTRADRSGRAIAGLSMGGYGAMRLGLKYSDKFCAIHSLSGALDAEARLKTNTEMKVMFGENVGPENDLFRLAERAKQATLPSINFDCGVDDYLIEHSRKFDRFLTEHRIEHSYTEYSGAHNWAYWNRHLLDALPKILDGLGISAGIDTKTLLGPD